MRSRSLRELFSGYAPVNRFVLVLAFVCFIAWATISYVANRHRIDENRQALAFVTEVDRLGRARACEIRDAVVDVIGRVIETSYANSATNPFQVLLDGEQHVIEFVTSPQAERARADAKARVLAELDSVPTCEGIEDAINEAAAASLYK
jgi:hypothetical protein